MGTIHSIAPGKSQNGHLGRHTQGTTHLQSPRFLATPGINRLEGFHHGDLSSYRCKLVPVAVNGAVKLANFPTVATTVIQRRRKVFGF